MVGDLGIDVAISMSFGTRVEQHETRQRFEQIVTVGVGEMAIHHEHLVPHFLGATETMAAAAAPLRKASADGR
jgi:hypothetical protein